MENKDKKKRRVELTVSKEMPLDAISLVAHPAIEQNFITFSTGNIVYVRFDGDKQIITGPAMIPDMDIDRVDPETGEQFQVFFTQDTVKQVAENYLKMHKQDAVNVEHAVPVNGITLFESWIIEDPANDKANALGYDLPKGTWMCSFKVSDTQFWTEQIKSGNVKGFSIEGKFLEFAKQKKQNQKMSKRKLSVYKKFKDVLNQIKTGLGMEDTFSEDTLQDGTSVVCDGEWVVGAEVDVLAADGSQTPIPDGTYQISDGTTFTTVGGSITEVAVAAPENGEGDAMAKPAVPAAPDAAAKPDATAKDTTTPDAGAKPDAADQDIQTQLDALKKEVEALKAAMKMKEEELSKANEQVTALSAEKKSFEAKIVELSAQPGATSIHKTAMAKSIEKEKNTYNSRLDRLHELRKAKA